MDVKAILEKRIVELDKKIEECEDEELRGSLVREMMSLTSEYSKLEANRLTLSNKETENKWKLKTTLVTGGIIMGSSVVGILLDSVTGRIEKRKEAKMQDNLTKMLK